MLHIDLKYLNLLSPKLDGFVRKKNDLWNTKCFACGDSAKKKNKKRGYFYVKQNSIFYRCFNCEYSTTLYKVIEQFDPTMAKEYAMERYFDNGGSKHGNYKKPEFEFKKPVFANKTKTDITIPSISSLSEDHFAKKYVLERKIPKGFHKDLFYAECFRSFVDKIYPEHNKNLIENDPRLIIPFRDELGNLKGFQGRSLNNNPLRYVTIKMDESLKLFGLDRVNKTETIYVLEGPLDATFIKNAVATADSNLTIAEYLGKERLVLVYDNEPRNKAIVKQIERAIDKDFKVCIFPETFKGKDINEAILNGLTKPEIGRIIESNVFSGMRAKIELNKWKRC